MEKRYIDADPDEHLDHHTLRSSPAVRPAWHGWQWMATAFHMLYQRWGSWLVISLFISALQLPFAYIGQYVPMVSLLQPLLLLLLVSGIQCAASAQEYDEEAPGIRHLFAVLEDRIFEFLWSYVLLLIFSLCAGLLFYGLIKQLGSFPFVGSYGSISTILLISLLFVSAVCIVYWFAPPLVFLQGESPLSGIILSLKSGINNILPMLVFVVLQWLLLLGVVLGSVLLAVIGHNILALVVILLFLLIYQVFMGLCCYVSYRDIWFD